MSEKIVRTPVQIKQAIGEKAVNTKAAATKLSDRIQLFEKWLNALPGRVETFCWRHHPDASPASPLEFGLRLHRVGKSWIISYGSYHPSYEPDDIEWKPLSEAPIALKIAAVDMFPDLLERIEKSQDELTARINKSCVEFDSFAAKLGIDGKERP